MNTLIAFLFASFFREGPIDNVAFEEYVSMKSPLISSISGRSIIRN